MVNGQANFGGYQEFTLDLSTRRLEPTNSALAAKDAALAQVFSPSLMAGRTVLDLGGNNGFFSMRALGSGAVRATVVDLDAECITNLGRLRARLPQMPLDAVEANFDTWEQPADVVLAFALVHWVYSCTSKLLSLDNIAARISALARDFAVIEWVDPTDPLVRSYGHTQVGSGQAEPYSFERFMRALEQRFTSVRLIAELSPTRRVLLASRGEIADLSWTAPLLHAKDTVLSSRKVCTIGGADFWSRVYRLDGSIIKQTSPELAERELAAIQAIADPQIGQVELIERTPKYWSLRLPFWEGTSLDQIGFGAPVAREELLALADRLVASVAKLRSKGVAHRDLHPRNVLVLADGSLRLIDFAWASVPGGRELTPATLGQLHEGERAIDVRPPEGGGDDLFAVGKLLLWLNRGMDPVVEFLGACLAYRDVRLRLSDPERARALVNSLTGDEDGDPGHGFEQLAGIAGAILCEAQESKRRLEEALQKAQAALEESTKALQRSKDEIEWMRNSLNWKIRSVWVSARDRLKRR